MGWQKRQESFEMYEKHAQQSQEKRETRSTQIGLTLWNQIKLGCCTRRRDGEGGFGMKNMLNNVISKELKMNIYKIYGINYSWRILGSVSPKIKKNKGTFLRLTQYFFNFQTYTITPTTFIKKRCSHFNPTVLPPRLRWIYSWYFFRWFSFASFEIYAGWTIIN